MFDTLSQCPHRSAHINQQVGRLNGIENRLVKFPVGLPVAFIELAHLVQGSGENLRVFKYCTILNHDTGSSVGLQVHAKLVRQKEHLGVEGPLAHFLVEIRKVWVFVVGFVEWGDVISAGQKFDQRRLPGTDITGNGDEFALTHGRYLTPGQGQVNMTTIHKSTGPLIAVCFGCLVSLFFVSSAPAYDASSDNADSESVAEAPPVRVLGELSFPTMAESEEAQAAFVQGMLLLHLFEYPLAREQFLFAQELEPGFAMAVWGEAMTFNQPVWGRQNREAGRLALQKLGNTPNARQDSTPAAREKLLIGALDILYGDGTKAERDRSYMRKMEQMAARFPEDHELQLFYALSVFGVHAGVRNIDSYMLATAISDAVFAENPRHPGAAHYLIHGVDDPVHAVLGLRAARALAEMAPDASHAQHMTSHIFTALGMWDDVVIANEAAVRVDNRIRAEEGMPPTSTGHYNSWLIYGYLQQGRFEKARELLQAAYVQATEHGKAPEDPLELHPDRSIVGSVTQMWLRYMIETRDWNGPVSEWSFRLGDAYDPNLNYNFAQAMRSANSSLPSKAFEQLQQFRRLKDELASAIGLQEEPSAKDLLYLGRLDVMEQQLLAMIEASKGEYDNAVRFAIEASNLEGELPRAYGPPYVDLPSAQLLGDLLIADQEPARAAEAYRLELERNRQRAAALSGLVTALELSGNEAEARFYGQKLALIWRLADEDVVER